jgi:hypothetical protein
VQERPSQHYHLVLNQPALACGDWWWFSWNLWNLAHSAPLATRPWLPLATGVHTSLVEPFKPLVYYFVTRRLTFHLPLLPLQPSTSRPIFQPVHSFDSPSPTFYSLFPPTLPAPRHPSFFSGNFVQVSLPLFRTTNNKHHLGVSCAFHSFSTQEFPAWTPVVGRTPPRLHQPNLHSRSLRLRCDIRAFTPFHQSGT